MLRKKQREAPFAEEGVMHATINGHRFHLRSIDPTEDNYLWIDGQPPLVLDRVAAEFVGYLIQGMWKFQQGEGDESDQVVRYVVENMYLGYGKPLALPKQRVTRRRIREDFHRIVGTLMGIAEGTCPVEAGLDSKEISLAAWAAPARMDLALTYRCNLACGKCYVGVGQKDLPELPSDLWKEILRRLWSIGVPQVVFTGGEPTLRQDLVSLVKEAEQFVTGLVTNGTLLAGLAKSLQDASLDYVQITVESSDPEIHDRMAGKAGAWQSTV